MISEFSKYQDNAAMRAIGRLTRNRGDWVDSDIALSEIFPDSVNRTNWKAHAESRYWIKRSPNNFEDVMVDEAGFEMAGI